MQIHSHSIYELGRRANTMADTADGNESVGSAETDATMDERDLPRSDETEQAEETEAVEDNTQSEWPEDAENGPADGGEDAPAAAESAEEDQEDFLRVSEGDVGGGVTLTKVSLPLPPVGVPGGRLRRQRFVFQRQLEEVLYGADGTYTGAIHRAVEVCVQQFPPPLHSNAASGGATSCAPYQRGSCSPHTPPSPHTHIEATRHGGHH